MLYKTVGAVVPCGEAACGMSKFEAVIKAVINNIKNKSIEDAVFIVTLISCHILYVSGEGIKKRAANPSTNLTVVPPPFTRVTNPSVS